MTGPSVGAPIHRIGVVGGGTMGSGIAEVAAAAGIDVLIVVSSAASGAAAQARIAQSLARQVDKGRLDATRRDEIAARITTTTEIGELADRDLVVEAIRESEPAKRELFAILDKVVTGDDAILASTTSGIPIGRLAQVTIRPERVIGLHFFSPVPSQALVEVIPSVLTGASTLAVAERFVAETLGKVPLRSPDRAGFVVNALLIPYLLAAVRMVEAGHVSAEGVDTAMTLACSYPIGPLKLADLIGLDVVVATASALYGEFQAPEYVPPPLLLRLVDAGLLGKKSGRGFHHYR